MSAIRKERSRFYRLYKRMRATFDSMFEYGIISRGQLEDWTQICESMHAEWKRQYRERNESNFGKRGRPKKTVLQPPPVKCKKEHCEKPPAIGQVYCSAEHAPLSHYGKNYRDP